MTHACLVIPKGVAAGLKIPDYDFAADKKEISELFDPIIKQADDMAQQATKRLSEIKEEMKRLDAERVSPRPKDLSVGLSLGVEGFHCCLEPDYEPACLLLAMMSFAACVAGRLQSSGPAW